MKDFLSNIWVKRSVAVFSVAYVGVIALLTYATFLYDLEMHEDSKGAFFTVYVIASIVFLGLMLYTKENKITCVLGLVQLPVVFCLILLNMGNWILIVPPFVVALIMFFACGLHETTKVVMGTIYLLLYVLGIVAYIVMNMLFGGTAVETVLDVNLDPDSDVYQLYASSVDKLSEVTSLENTVSPDGKYRFYLVDVQDSDRGEVKVYVVPYGQDRELKFFTLKQKGIRKTITNKVSRGTVPDVGWLDEKTIQYRIEDGGDLKETVINVMPSKQYLEFLGVS